MNRIFQCAGFFEANRKGNESFIHGSGCTGRKRLARIGRTSGKKIDNLWNEPTPAHTCTNQRAHPRSSQLKTRRKWGFTNIKECIHYCTLRSATYLKTIHQAVAILYVGGMGRSCANVFFSCLPGISLFFTTYFIFCWLCWVSAESNESSR